MTEVICPRCKKRLPSPAQFCTRCGATMASRLPPVPPVSPAINGYRPPMQPLSAANYYGPSYMRTRRPGGIFFTILFIFVFLHGIRACSSIVPVIHAVNSRGPLFSPMPPMPPMNQNPWQTYGR